MSVMKVRSFNKNGLEINMKDIVLDNENVYKILKKYINKTKDDKIRDRKMVKV